MLNNTSKKDFKLFKKECLYWIEVLGLIDYEIFFWHSDDIEDCRGACIINPSGRIGEIYLAINWNTAPVSKKAISKVAFHEAVELFIGDLVAKASDRFTTSEQIEAASHRVIRVLEKLLFTPYYKVMREESKG